MTKEAGFVPEGAMWTNGCSFWKEGAEGRIMFWHSEGWYNCLACTTSAGLDAADGIERICPADADGWVSLPALPAGPMLCEVRTDAKQQADRTWWAYFKADGEFGPSASTSTFKAMLFARISKTEAHERVLAWRPAQEAQKAGEPKPPAPPFVRRVRAAVAGGVMDSDRAGIDAFTAPPERERSPVAQPRISTAQRSWRWLEGWR